MATYAIGDIRAVSSRCSNCCKIIRFNPQRDTLWLAGDLVNQHGPGSLEVLRWAYSQRDALRVVLGQSRPASYWRSMPGMAKHHDEDTLQPILDAPDKPYPFRLAAAAEAGASRERLADGACRTAAAMDGRRRATAGARGGGAAAGPTTTVTSCATCTVTSPATGTKLQGNDRLRLIVNAMTRMRLVTADGAIDLKFKGELDDAPPELCAWFAAAGRRSADTQIVCGHWSALGSGWMRIFVPWIPGCLWVGI